MKTSAELQEGTGRLTESVYREPALLLESWKITAVCSIPFNFIIDAVSIISIPEPDLTAGFLLHPGVLA